MIPNNDNRTLKSNVANSTPFGISMVDEVHLMNILRDTLYSDKVLAVLREYSANAWDAHRAAGNPVPIKVTIPTSKDQTLTIRDFGTGLSPSDVAQVYTQYGASTKRGNDSEVGMLGIGSKSGFAYSDSFTVTSYHGGTKRVYVAVLDESNRGTMNLVHEEPTDQTGVEIKITVRPEDIYEFQNKARDLFRHFTPRPEINIDLPPLPAENTTLVHGSLSTEQVYGWIAIMGCVPYRINLDQLPNAPAFLGNISGSLNFGIGEVEISASREDLKYGTRTKTALTEKFTAVVDEYIEHTLNSLEDGSLSRWDIRLRVTVLDALDLPIPEDWKDLAEGHVKIEYSTADFTVISNRSAVTRITVDDTTRVILDDVGNDLKGYHLNHNDYVLRATNKGVDVNALRTALDACLEQAGLTGVPIVMLSTVPYTAPYKKQPRKVNVKHRAKMFRLDLSRRKSHTPSTMWEIETRVPTNKDVYVILESFRPYDSFLNHYKADCELAEVAGLTVPTVYGYKSTEKKPAKVTDGKEYQTWRAEVRKSLITADVLSDIQSMYWDNALALSSYHKPGQEDIKRLQNELGADHPIVVLLAPGPTRRTKYDNEHLVAFAVLAGLKAETSDAQGVASAVRARYPLLHSIGFEGLWADSYYKGRAEAWIDYVQVTDIARPLP